MNRYMTRITVLKRMDNRQIQESETIAGYSGPCHAFEVGQSFEAGWELPEGFCSFAWADIHNEVKMIQCGGSQDHLDAAHTAIACCKDALCPVVFKIERITRSMRGGEV